MRHLYTLLLSTAALALAFNDFSVFADSRHEAPVNAGISAYENGHYEAALNSFKRALQSSPDDSTLHHWLGKCYGRIAENSHWLKAVTYSKKTLEHFQRAVELDRNNRDALRDLISYHTKAPGFLGGSKKEAARLTTRLETLENANKD